MATVTGKAARMKGGSAGERTVVYHGIRIAPMTGKRSAVAKAVRDALRAKCEQRLGERNS
jgi:hypothetical protein